MKRLIILATALIALLPFAAFGQSAAPTASPTAQRRHGAAGSTGASSAPAADVSRAAFP